MKRAFIICILTAGGIVLWQSRIKPPAVAIASPPPVAGEELRAVTLVFGQKDNQPAKWDGSAAISAGKIERIAGYHFTRKDSVNGAAWQCASYPWPGHPHEMWPSQRPAPHPYLQVPIGVTIYYRAPADAEVRVNLAQGEFAFRPAELPEIESIYPLRALVEVRRSPVVETISESRYEDDYPSMAAEGNRIWVAWQAYRDKADRIFLRGCENGRCDAALEVTDKPGDLFMTGVAAAHGAVTVVWSAHEGSGWNLKARTYDGKRFGPAESVTTGDNNNLWHRVTADRSGNVHVVYQSWRKGRSDIYLRSRENGKWTPEVLLSDTGRDARADDWDPAVAADRDGTVWAVWDGYATGSYNLYLRPVRHGKPGAIVKVTDTTRFHAHPSVAVDGQNRVWIAYDEAPENWGKDVGFLFSGGTGLYQSRAVKVAVYNAGRWQTPLRQPADVIPDGFHRYVQTPRLAAGSDGRMWLFLRPRTESRFPASLWAAGGKWEVCATYYNGDRWSDLIMLPDSVGRDEGELAAAPDAQGNAWVALVTDHKMYGGPDFGELPGNNDIQLARVRSEGSAQMVLGDLPPEPPGGLPSEPKEKQEIARLRNYAIRADGKNLKIYRGEMHRHTEISHDGAGDGTLWDAYRYGMNAADMDFLVVTDHQSGDQEYTWWRIEKAADMFHVPGYFTAIYGTERSVGYPNGHRNLLYARRGVPVLPIGRDEMQAKVNSGSVLYPFLKQYDGIATPHSPHTTMGTDWRDNDPAVEPIVELFEGSRTSAEHEGAPLAPSAKRTELWAGQYRPLGFVWNAWAKGYRLGVQASSDHVSTHMSYTMVLAGGSSREALIDAMRKRHTYAATTNILLDYRMKLNGETYIQGDEAQSRTLPEISATMQGTGPLAKVVIVRDNQYIYSQEPQGDKFELRYRESSLTPGRHYYYVRLEQKNKHMAWSSPIWVDYNPNGK